MRNPNGYGSITKLSGNRRRPYMVKKTVGYDDRAYPIYSVIGYYETRKDALLALAEYNYNPYDINRSKYTFQQLYDDWSRDVLPKYKTALQKSLITAYGHCARLYDIEYKQLRRLQMQECIDNCGLSQASQSNIRNLFVKLDEYAFDLDIITKQYSSMLTVSQTDPVIKRTPFSSAEIALLWEHENECPEILFMLYTGMRISETATISPVHIEGGIIRYGMKTKAGKGRIVPIHPAIKHLVDERMNNELLWGHGSDPSRNLRCKFEKVMGKYGMSHLPHDTRHTFRSELDRRGANPVCIDLLMGHVSKGTGERIYTHKTIEELENTIRLLAY